MFKFRKKDKEVSYQKVPPTKRRGKREKFRKSKNDPFWTFIADVFFFSMIENRFYSMKIKDGKNFKLRNPDYPCIFYAPHSNWWDGLVGYNLCKRFFNKKINIMVEELNRFPILSLVGAFSVDKTSPQQAIKALKYSVEVLKDKEKVIWIFPQGIINPPNARPIEFQTGLTYIAQNSIKEYGGINLCPLAINYAFLREDKPEIIVDVGEPIILTDATQDRHELTKYLENNFTQLCDKQLDNIHKGNVDDYEYIFKQILPWYKRFEKWLKRI